MGALDGLKSIKDERKQLARRESELKTAALAEFGEAVIKEAEDGVVGRARKPLAQRIEAAREYVAHLEGHASARAIAYGDDEAKAQPQTVAPTYGEGEAQPSY